MEKAEQWPKRVATLMEKRLDYLESIPVADLTMKELRELSATTKETNEMAREAYGISDQAPKVYVGLMQNLVEIKLAPKVEETPVIQSVPEPEQLPPA